MLSWHGSPGLLAACGGSGGHPAAGAAGSTGTLTIIMNNPPVSLNPAKQNVDPADPWFETLAYDSLLNRGPDGSITPGLATSWGYTNAAHTQFQPGRKRLPCTPRPARAGPARARLLTGEIGVCLVTAGPGATNLLTGIAEAYVGALPILILAGRAPTATARRGAQQEVPTSVRDDHQLTVPFSRTQNALLPPSGTLAYGNDYEVRSAGHVATPDRCVRRRSRERAETRDGAATRRERQPRRADHEYRAAPVTNG
ncbi:MAG TPA: thiamine pyrophosphate-binding protein [Streptosporangiaceae bacterium]|nr:thiamine pyrophosphate-binding protein [Streptosporangiaceae bacterium]